MFKLNRRMAIPKRFKRRQRPNYHKLHDYESKINTIVFFRKSGYLGIRIYSRLIRYFRKFVKRRKYLLKFKIPINYIMTRKPTNSRMGKGKGSIKGFLIRASANRPFIITKGVSPRRISAFFKKEVGVSQLKFAVRAVVTSK